MRIGELAVRTGVSVRSLRYYEQQGLLAPRRTSSGQRLYGFEHEAIVGNIRDLLDAGFCSSVIATLIPALSQPGTAGEELGAAFDAARDRLVSEKRAIEKELAALEMLRSRWVLAPDAHVRDDSESHDDPTDSPAASFDHRDRRLRRGAPFLP